VHVHGARVHIAHHHALGQLEDQAGRRDLSLLEHLPNFVDELGSLQLEGRHIDGYREWGLARAFALHVGCPFAGLAENVAPKRDDHSGGLHQRDEVERGDYSARGMLPANERLHASHLVSGEIDYWLIAKRDLSGLQGSLEI